uniref:Uncharacterized protein n=1 Tax=Eutreptiella gymnastica TaxID=73025 RepID=A0A7S4FN49_9EUGL
MGHVRDMYSDASDLAWGGVLQGNAQAAFGWFLAESGGHLVSASLDTVGGYLPVGRVDLDPQLVNKVLESPGVKVLMALPYRPREVWWNLWRRKLSCACKPFCP